MIRANLAVGLNWPVSIELMVLRETPTSSANCAWENFFSARASFKWFFSISRSVIDSPIQIADMNVGWLTCILTSKLGLIIYRQVYLSTLFRFILGSSRIVCSCVF